MKRILTIGLILFITGIASSEVSAQRILDRAVNKAKQKLEQKAEEKIEEKIDEKIDQEIEKLEEKNRKEREDTQSRETPEERSQRRTQGILKGLGITGEPVPFEDSYSFSTKIKMQIESFDNKGKKISEGDFVTYMNPKEANFAYEVVSGDVGNKGKGIFILDFKNKASIILSEENGRKTGLVYGLNFMLDENLASEGYNEEEIENVEFTTLNPYISKTGRTKRILGYNCEEFHYNNPEEKQEARYWITRDLSIKTRDFFGALFNAATFSHGMGWGYLMESESLNNETGEKTKMLVTDLNTNSNTRFAMSGYQITNIGSINIPTGEQ